MKNILNNKILPIILIALIVVFSVTSSVFAGEITVNNETVETSSTFDDYISGKNFFILSNNIQGRNDIWYTSYTLYIIEDLSDFSLSHVTNNNGEYYFFKFENEGTLKAFSYYKYNSDTTLNEVFSNFDVSQLYNETTSHGFYGNKFVYSSCDLRNFDNSDEVFFKAPLGTLAQVVEQEVTPEKVLAQIKMILLVLLIGIVSLIGFRKTLKFMKGTLSTK